MSERAASTSSTTSRPRTALLQFIGLALFAMIAFRRELALALHTALQETEAAGLLAAPVLALLLLWRRRARFAEVCARGSWWGAVLIGSALAILALATWPFNYMLPRQLAFPVALAGAVLAVAGWRTFWHALPIMLLLAVAIPVGARFYAFLALHPELLTLRAARATLEALPGVHLVELHGPDLHFLADRGEGTIALGEPHRGASLLFASMLVIIFVTFSRIRRAWQILAMGAVALPLVLASNFIRLMIWGLLSIYAASDPASPAPRAVASVASLLLVYVMIALLGRIVSGSPARRRPAHARRENTAEPDRVAAGSGAAP